MPPHFTRVIAAYGKESGPLGSKIQHQTQVAEGAGASMLSPGDSDVNDAQLIAYAQHHRARLPLLDADHRLGGTLSSVAEQGKVRHD